MACCGAMTLRRAFWSLPLIALAACSSVSPRVQDAPSAAAVAQAVPVEALNADVSQQTIGATICVSGYAASVRPVTSYSNAVKAKLMHEQGLPASALGDYELDHRIPLALGGHPRSPENLALQRWDGEDGAKAKDRLERHLRQLVCAGKVLLDDARRAIYWDWRGAYRRYVTAN